ncbi:Tumor protein 63 [Schistosoma haematobium]|uniref:Tumor protein 63 n=1 Tax=Schistosoma haematobium TaxID=6185 RepID=A0A922LXI8_SCHHA|nr:Tumor protein 63 [Schistosoma haematobium]KAH9595372.1 Tumor protein 63 [Schistosoma haematobium]CAH8463832.1 unnamed protein product [Schistosoma haematobium]CAH8465151.1 unnamed protein product [Schistosoma haematobium]
MNITLLMNETDSVQCHSVNVISDSIDDYTNLSNVQYIHKHNTSNNSSNNNTSSTINNHSMLITNHKSNSNSNTNELSTTDCTNLADNLNSSSNCTSPNGSTLTMYGTQHRFKISPNTYHDLENGNSLTTTSIGPRPDTDLDSAFPPKKLYTDDIPVLESFPGFYGFDLYRPLCGDTYEASETKPSTAFFYFKDEQGWTNLYAKKTPTWWTLSYWCQRKPPEGSFIRLTPVYGASDKQQEVIQRCFEDFMAIPTTGMGRYSIVMVGNSLAEYFFDPITERLCVTLPYETPKEGCEYSQFNGKFMCFNSCLYNGGQGNKKPLFLIITLERLITGSDPSKGHCEVLGRQCIKFRSCACPKRDKENNERRTGDSLVIGTPSLGKRRKESNDRNDRQVKRIRSNQRPSSVCNINNITNASIQNNNGVNYEKDTNVLREHSWLSPNNEYLINDEKCPSEPNGFDDIFDYYGQENDYDGYGQNTIHFNGESYNLLLVPTNLPGAVETLSSVRYGLLRAWIYALAKHHYHHHNQQYHMTMKQSPLTNDLNNRKETKSDTNINNHTSSLNITNNVNTNMMVGKNTTEKRSDTSESRYYPTVSGNYSHSYNRAVIGSTLNHWLKTESHLAALVRERINLLNMYQQTYHFSGDSTDSQPNSTLSTGAMGFNGTGNLDEPVNILNQDYFNSSNMNGSVGSELMNSNLPRNLSNHQTNIMQNMAAYILSSTSTNTTTSTTTTATSINNIGNRGFIYNTPNAVDTNWSYETDSDLRTGQTSHTDQLYESTHHGLIIGNNNNSSTLHVVSELIDPYGLVQHLPQSLSSSSPVHQHHHIHSHHIHSAHVQSQHNHQIHLHQGMNNSTSISDTNDNHSSAFTTTALISENTMNNKSLTLNTCLLPQITPTTTTTVADTGTIGTTNFGHDFNTSNFYTTAYFNLTNSNANADNNSNGSNNNVIDCTNANQSNDMTNQNSTLIDSLSRPSIPSNLNHRSMSQNSTLCNYQLTNHTNLSESLLLSEELLHNCLDNKKKCYDEPDGVHSILTKHLRNTSFCLSSTRSPESCGAEKFVKLEI